MGPLLPGESVTRHYTVSVRAVGEVQAQVSVAAKGTHSSAATSQWAVPWGLVAMVVVILALVVLTLVRWRRRRHRAQAVPASVEEPMSHQSAQAGAEADGASAADAEGGAEAPSAARVDEVDDAED